MGAWNKLGLSVAAPGTGLMQSHAMLPTPLILADKIRVFFTSCDDDLRGRVFYADLSRTFPYRVLHIETTPVLDLGKPGAFDADSVNPGHLVVRDGTIYLYYIGWQRVSAEVPYTLFTGLAVSTDEGVSFVRHQEDPVLKPHGDEVYFRTAPFAWREGDEWKMLYIGGGQFFTSAAGKRLPLYDIKLTSSADGLKWDGPSHTLLQPDRERDQIGFGRPVLWHDSEGRRSLMVSVRTTAGYTLSDIPYDPDTSISADLQPVLPCGPEEWDSEMTCFGSPIIVDNREVLFYNGNQFGRTGFGIAWRDCIPSWQKDIP